MKRTWVKGLVIFLFLTSTCHMLQAQETSKEISATVPALTEFHKVIYTIWHTTWPNRDTDMLTALLPEIERGTAVIVNARSPGILRDEKRPRGKRRLTNSGVLFRSTGQPLRPNKNSRFSMPPRSCMPNTRSSFA